MPSAENFLTIISIMQIDRKYMDNLGISKSILNWAKYNNER